MINCNKTGVAKELLFQALNKTKVKNGPALQAKTEGKDIDGDEFFGEIENYKAEFAMNLLDVIKAKENEQKRRMIGIPQYIVEGFSHITGSNGQT